VTLFGLFFPQSYYNKDTIESIRQGRGLTDVTDPSDAIYTSVDGPSSSTPAHQSNLTASVDNPLEDRAEFLRSKAAPRTSPAKVEGDGKGKEEEIEEEGYYNVKHHKESDDEDAYDYYNSVQGLSGGSNQPLIDPEDNQYIYIEKSAVPQPAPALAAPAATGTGKPSVAAKPRHLSEPNTSQPKKYINLGPNQRQVLQGKVQGTAGESTDKKSRGDSPHAPISNGLANGGSGVSDSEDQPLYENLREEGEGEEEDEGGKEIYENIMQ
jgi:hypothetical protein